MPEIGQKIYSCINCFFVIFFFLTFFFKSNDFCKVEIQPYKDYELLLASKISSMNLNQRPANIQDQLNSAVPIEHLPLRKYSHLNVYKYYCKIYVVPQNLKHIYEYN